MDCRVKPGNDDGVGLESSSLGIKQIAVFPKRAARMNQENPHGIGQTAKQQDTGALFGHRLFSPN
jgi:hypothetical protein